MEDKHHNSSGDPTKLAYVRVLQFITDNFYSDNKDKIVIELSSKGKGENFYDEKRIVLSEQLVDAFGHLNLPRFIVYYHELGHYLYSKGLFDLIRTWEKVTQGPIEWHPKYMHLLNWIEDYYIEDRLIKEHSYLTDVLGCIKKLPPDYDIKRLEYAFNYWYIHGSPTPALQYNDQVIFKSYVMRLLTMRDGGKIRFGQGVLTTLSIKPTNDTKFVMLLIEFYNWCVAVGIFPKEESLPELSNPNNHLKPVPNTEGDETNEEDTPGTQDAAPPNSPPKESVNAERSNGKKGSYSDHSHNVGKTQITYEEEQHIKSPTTVFKDELVQENKLIERELLDMSQRVDAANSTLDGLFSTKYRDSTIIQPRVIVPNFFNPNRLADQTLFKEKEHTYMNVAIYRDISGSTAGEVHNLMSHVCDKLQEDIPVDITYYLYSSGDVSIIEVPYVRWEKTEDIPKIYRDNPLFDQLRGGTNSSAIADVITQQLSDKWLNIIITDGDLHDLMRRDNISALLRNVFVISVGQEVKPGLLGMTVLKKEDINSINNTLSTINLSR